MNTQEAKQLSGKALEELTAALGRGQSEALKAYLETLARFHRYSWNNALLIARQRPDATRVAGYRAWQRMGRYIKRGERAIVILAPLVYRIHKPDTDAGEETAAPAESSPMDRVLGFRGVPVFDVAQTEGRPLPDMDRISGDPKHYIERLKALVARRGIALEYLDWIDGAEGASSKGRIALRTGLDPANEFAVLAHELAHSMLHFADEPRLDNKAVLETEAEAVAFVVCRAIRLETGSACSDYIQLHSGTKQTLAASLGRIQRTAATIIEGIQVMEEPPVRVAA